MKENVKIVSQKLKETNEIMRLNSVDSKTWKTDCADCVKDTYSQA